MNALHSYKRVLYVGILFGLILSLTVIFPAQIRAASPVKGLGGATNLPVVVLPPQISSVILNPNSVTGGTAQVIGRVILNQPAPAGGVAVIFRSSNPAVAAVPPGVTVQPGATSATFIFQPQPVAINPNVVTGPPSVQISAQAGNSSPVIAQLTVLPPTIVSLTLNPANVGGGSVSTGTIGLTGPAPSGGIVVTLSANATTSAPTSPSRALEGRPLNQPSVSLPKQVTIPAGVASASFAISTRAVSASTSVNITAAWGVFVTKTATLTLLPPGVASVSLIPVQLFGGNPSTGTVTLNAPAPSEGMTVYLRTSRAWGGTTGTFAQCGELPTVPSTVTVAGGSISATFPVTTYPGYGVYWAAASGTATFSSSVQHRLDVNTPGFSLIVPSSVKGGTAIQGTIQLTGPAMPANCGKYTLTSNNTNLAQVPPYVYGTPDTNQAAVPITTAALSTATGPQTVTIYVTGPLVNNGAPTVGYYTTQRTLTVTP